MSRVSYHYSGASKGYHITLDGDDVHFTQDAYQRDMFMAELKAKINTLSINTRLAEQNQRLVEALEEVVLRGHDITTDEILDDYIRVFNIAKEAIQAYKLSEKKD